MTPLLFALALAGSPPMSLETCDQVTHDGETSPHAYTCYGAIAQSQPEANVLEHLEAQLREHTDDGRLWLTLGGLQLDRGVDCEPALRRAIEVLTASKEDRYRVQAHLNLANRLEYSGDVDGALEQLAFASSVAETTGHWLLTTAAALEQDRAIIRFATGDIVSAQARLEAMLAELPSEAPPMIKQRLLVGIRDAAVYLGRPREALQWSEALAEACRDAGDDYALSTALLTSAQDAYELASSRHVAQAETDYRTAVREALEVAKRSGNRFVEASAAMRLAEVSEPEDRLAAYERCMLLAIEVEDEDRRARCEAGRAIALIDTNLPAAESAADALARRVAAFDVAEFSVQAHRAKAEVAHASGDLDRAWKHWSAMLRALDERRNEQTSRAARRNVHADRIDHFREVADPLLEAGQVDRALVVLEWMRARDAKEWAALVHLDYRPMPEVTVASIQESLVPQEALVVYLVGLPRSWALIVTPTKAHTVELPGASWILPAADMSTAMLADASASTTPTSSLYDELVAPVVATLDPPIDRLVIVADDGLARLPMAALTSDDNTALLERYAVSSVPSVGLWTALRTVSTGTDDRGVLALADPPVRANPVPGRSELPPLPGARAEAEYAHRLLGGSLRIGSDASETALESARTYTVLHIGAHVIIDTDRPESSAVVLAQDAKHDGVTSLEELGRLELGGTLVVLAACQGADGNVIAGEGTLSPARALFVGGARTVVAGLWPVRDDEASQLFQLFYRHLDAGVPVAKALARSQAELRERGVPASAWAGFIVIGDGEFRLPRRPQTPTLGWALLSAFIAGGLAFGLHRAFAGRLHPR